MPPQKSSYHLLPLRSVIVTHSQSKYHKRYPQRTSTRSMRPISLYIYFHLEPRERSFMPCMTAFDDIQIEEVVLGGTGNRRRATPLDNWLGSRTSTRGIRLESNSDIENIPYSRILTSSPTAASFHSSIILSRGASNGLNPYRQPRPLSSLPSQHHPPRPVVRFGLAI